MSGKYEEEKRTNIMAEPLDCMTPERKTHLRAAATPQLARKRTGRPKMRLDSTCPVCKKVFRNSLGYEEHRRTHTGVLINFSFLHMYRLCS